MQRKDAADSASQARPYMDQSAVNYTPSQVASTSAGSMSGQGWHRSIRDDDEQSKASVYTSYTATSENSERLVRNEGGRDFNILNDQYALPADVPEWDRLDKQHRGFTMGLGGLYPAPEVVRAILAPEEGITKRIADLGCGTGIWAIEMAREFPHCEILGLDLAPVPIPPSSIPPNCQFEMDDINLGLTHLRGLYDVVNCRAIGMGLRDFRKSLADIEACLKPGGILIWMDGDYYFYSGWPMAWRPYWSQATPHGSYAVRVLWGECFVCAGGKSSNAEFIEVQRSAHLSGSGIKTMEKVIEEGFWTNSTVLDPDTCKTGSLYLPIGTWCEYGDLSQREQLRYVGILMRQDFIEASRTTQPFLLKTGWSQQTTDRWAAGMRDECQNDTIGLRMRLAWGRRRAGPAVPAPPLQVVSSTSTSGSQGMSKYPFFEVYDTQEQALAQAAIRNKGKDIPEPPIAALSTE